MQTYNESNKYGEYSDLDHTFSLNDMDDDELTQYTKSLLHWAANDSHMKDVGMAKWQLPTAEEADKRDQWALSFQLANNNKIDLLQHTTTSINNLDHNITITNTNTDLIITPEINDPFFEPFGDCIQLQKPPSTFQVAL